MSQIAEVVLTGQHVRLEPLRLAHIAPLVAAANESRQSYGLSYVPADEAAMRAYVDTALSLYEQGQALPFATLDLARSCVVGTTRFANIERWSWPPDGICKLTAVDFEAAEIGWTWLAASAQRTAINTEAKLLMLGHAFEVWRLVRVNLKTDVRNARSRSAIERIGARLDGILRAQMPASDGGLRDSAMYSMLGSEWPEAKEKLLSRLGK